MRDPENQMPTQAAKVLAELRRYPNRWVPMPQLASVSGAYAVHSRIAELRGDGHQIETRIEGTRPRRSFYRLVTVGQAEMEFNQEETR